MALGLNHLLCTDCALWSVATDSFPELTVCVFCTNFAGQNSNPEKIMDKKRIVFIVNPISGTGSKTSVVNSIEENIDKNKFDYEISTTEYAGHATILASRAAGENVHAVVAVGGDGTVNEVARSVVHTQTALGIVPCGSGNGLARHLQIPMIPEKAIRIINEDTIHCLDHGVINGHPFFCTCGVGFDAFIIQKFAESGKRGLKTYVENTLREGLIYKPDTYTIEDEKGTFKDKAFLIACANASQYGNNAFIAPYASMKDGLMDVIVMEPFNPLEAPQIVLQLFNKTLPQNSHVKTFRSQKIKIHRNGTGAVHCDGDPFVTGEDINIEIIKQSFNVMVNPAAHSEPKNPLQILSGYFNEWTSLPYVIKKRGESLIKMNRAMIERMRKL